MEVVLMLAILAGSTWSNPTLRSGGSFEQLVASAAEATFDTQTPCVFILVHDYADLPPEFVDLLARIEGKGHAAQNLHVGNNVSLPIPDHPKHIEYWFSWLSRPMTPQRQWSCIFYVMVFNHNNFKIMMETMAKNMLINTMDDMFFMWDKDGDLDTTFMHDHAVILRQKVGVSKSDLSDTLQLKSVSFFADRGHANVVTICKYDQKRGFFDSNYDSLFPDFTTDLNGLFLTGTYVYPIKPDQVRRGHKELAMINFPEAYITDIGQYMNFDFDVAVFEFDPTKDSVDTELADGSWMGQIGDVLYRRHDFGVGTAVNAPAMKVISWPRVFCYTYITYITRAPRPTYTWSAIHEPYTPSMWLLIFLSGVLYVVTFRVVIYILYSVTNPFQPEKGPTHTWGYSVRYIFSTLIEENPNLIPTAHTTRVLLAFWWVFSDVITCGYDTKLISFLAAPQMEVLPSDFKELVHGYDKWEMGMDAAMIGFFTVFTEEAEVEHIHKVKPRLQVSSSMWECLEMAMEKDFACVNLDAFVHPLSLLYVDSYGTYPFKHSRENTIQLYASMVLPKHSVISPAVSQVTARMDNAGLIEMYTKKFLYTCKIQGIRIAESLERLYTESRDLKVQQLKGPFVLWLVLTACLAPIVFLGEIIHEKKNGGR